MKPYNLVFAFYLLFLLGCTTNPLPHIQEIQTPSQQGGASNLFVDENGEAYMSWVEYLNDSTDALMVSKLVNNKWEDSQQVAQGTDWFVNWADFPSIVVNDETWAAHWLQKSAGGVYDYDVRISQSTDEGQNWSESFIIHRDSIAAEHGFVSMLPLGNGNILATWLDGRNTKTEDDAHDDHDHGGHGAGAMTLRTAEFDIKGNIFAEAELDNKICDCCQTSAALTPNGPVIVYRDRSDEEMRDISYVRLLKEKWTTPQKVSDDQWKIAGCPVNGPSIDANDNQIVVAWYTMKDEQPLVNVAFSSVDSDAFQTPIQVDNGHPLGRVDVAYLNDEQIAVSWLEQRDSLAGIRCKLMDANGNIQSDILIAETSDSRSSGFPIMKKYKDGLLFSWTAVDSLTTIKSAYLTW